MDVHWSFALLCFKQKPSVRKTKNDASSLNVPVEDFTSTMRIIYFDSLDYHPRIQICQNLRKYLQVNSAINATKFVSGFHSFA